MGPALLPGVPLLFVFALGSAYFFGTAWAKLKSHDITVRAGERAYLMLVFEKCAEDGIEFSTPEVARFLRLAPDWPG